MNKEEKITILLTSILCSLILLAVILGTQVIIFTKNNKIAEDVFMKKSKIIEKAYNYKEKIK